MLQTEQLQCIHESKGNSNPAQRMPFSMRCFTSRQKTRTLSAPLHSPHSVLNLWADPAPLSCYLKRYVIHHLCKFTALDTNPFAVDYLADQSPKIRALTSFDTGDCAVTPQCNPKYMLGQPSTTVPHLNRLGANITEALPYYYCLCPPVVW
jgi:hypothetical protein